MKTVLTGIQSSGKPHIGNYFGAIKPIFELSKEHNSILFIADIHSLTTVKNPAERKENLNALTAFFLSFGFDYNKNMLFKQSDIPQICELQFYLSCFIPYTLLTGAHSFKDKATNLTDVNVGLFTYPVLMAADILMFDADLIPVGKDQKQHLEITRDIACKFNNTYGNILKLPTAYYTEAQETIPGIDGRKMSKSYGNIIDPFIEENKLRKLINKIITDSKDVNAAKDYETDITFKLYQLFSSQSEIEELKEKYLNGLMYSEAKKYLFEKLNNYFKPHREEYNKILAATDYIQVVLNIGKEKALIKAENKITQIKKTLGFI